MVHGRNCSPCGRSWITSGISSAVHETADFHHDLLGFLAVNFLRPVSVCLVMMHYQGQLPVDQNDPESEPAPSIVSSADHRRPPPPWYAAPPPIIDPARLEELHSKLDILMRTNQWLVDEIIVRCEVT